MNAWDNSSPQCRAIVPNRFLSNRFLLSRILSTRILPTRLRAAVGPILRGSFCTCCAVTVVFHGLEERLGQSFDTEGQALFSVFAY